MPMLWKVVRAVIGLGILTFLMTMYERLVYPGSW
jgi:hypothetical protein